MLLQQPGWMGPLRLIRSGIKWSHFSTDKKRYESLSVGEGSTLTQQRVRIMSGYPISHRRSRISNSLNLRFAFLQKEQGELMGDPLRVVAGLSPLQRNFERQPVAPAPTLLEAHRYVMRLRAAKRTSAPPWRSPHSHCCP
jgi:hypothetical protein